MSTSKRTYTIRSREFPYSEAKTYIDGYREAIAKPGSRYHSTLKFIPRESSVLDYGCGWGVFSEMISRRRGCDVFGIDIDSKSVEIAKDIVGESDLLKFSTAKIAEIADDGFDVVVSMQVLEHTHNPGNYLAHCNRVLKPGGRLVISVPNIMNPRFMLPLLRLNQQERFKRISAEVRSTYDKTHHHVHAWDPSTFCRLLATVGFDYVSHEFTEGIPLPMGRYWTTRIPGIRNWSYSMVFAFEKIDDAQVKSIE
jgi:2-polyprenyl-3-methyl-5-hydroxy-6-metoxy-1,4-benzoquinol methylase